MGVGVEAGERAGTGAGGEDDVPGGELGGGAVALDGDAVGTVQAAVAVVDAYLVLLEKMADAIGELAGDGARALDDLLQVETDVVGGEAELVEMMQQVIDLGRTEQRLGGDAAPVEADAAEMFAFDHGRRHAELGGADGGDVAARAAADDDDVETVLALAHRIISSGSSRMVFRLAR